MLRPSLLEAHEAHLEAVLTTFSMIRLSRLPAAPLPRPRHG
jgi:hypothetical protein